MAERAIACLGAPDLRLGGLQFWVHGHEFPDAEDAWDGNWLRMTAHCGAAGASVWASGALLDTVSVLRFRRALGTLYETLCGEAVLEAHEPNIVVRVTASDRLGHLSGRVGITPDHMAQGHWFESDADQTYLPEVVAACDTLLLRLPVRNPDKRGV